MSMTIAPDYRMSTPLADSKKCEGKHSDLTSPHLKIVHTATAMRHLTLSRMFPMWTPEAERIVDYLMDLSEEEYLVLCDHDGERVVMTHEKLAMIGEALGPVESLDLTLDDDEFIDDLDGPDLNALDPADESNSDDRIQRHAERVAMTA